MGTIVTNTPKGEVKNKPATKKRGLIYSASTENVVSKKDLFSEPRTLSDIMSGVHPWMWFLDDENKMMANLLSLLNSSGTLRSIINAKSTLVMGDGFVAKDSNTSPSLSVLRKLIKAITGNDKRVKDLNDWLDTAGGGKSSIEKEIKKAVIDFNASGNAYIQLRRGVDSNAQKTFHVFHIPWNQVLLEKPDKETRDVEHAYISEFWDNQYTTTYKPSRVAIYPEWSFDDNNPNDKFTQYSLVHLAEYSQGFIHYGMPEWVAALLWIELEYRIPKHNVVKFENGFVASGVLQLFGNMTEIQAKKMVKDIIGKFTGTGNNSKLLVQILSSEASKMNYQKLDDNADGDWLELSNLVESKIITAMRWASSLIGVPTPGKLGNSQQVKEEFQLINALSVKPQRREFVNEVLNPIVKEAAQWLGKFNGISVDILDSTPISFTGQIDPNGVLTINEQREVLGYEAMEGGDVLISDSAPAQGAAMANLQPAQKSAMNAIWKQLLKIVKK
jgi:hypothetical protein